MCSHNSQPCIYDLRLDLFKALDLFMPSILQYGSWLWCSRHKHSQFSEFRTVVFHTFDMVPQLSKAYWK